MPRRNLLFALVSITVLLLVAPTAVITAVIPAGDTETEIWKNESFMKKAEAIKEGNWNKAGTRDVAIIGLYEMGRALDRMERRLQSRTERLSAFVYWGALVVAIYLVLQLVLSLTVIVRLGRRQPQRNARGAEPPGDEFRL